MKKGIILMLAIGMFACKKNTDNNQTGNGGSNKIVDTVNVILVHTYKFATGYDTTGNYIATIGFQRRDPELTFDRVGDTTIGIAGYTATSSDRNAKYTIRYVGVDTFVRPEDIVFRFPDRDIFYLNKTLLGKALFEVYDIKTSQLVKRLVCGRDSAEVQFSYTVWENPNITPQQNADALNYYLNTKQTDHIHYY